MSTLKDLEQVIGRARTAAANARPGVYSRAMELGGGKDKNSPEDLPDILCLGDNLNFMKALLAQDAALPDQVGSLRGKIQMIYIDPPFYTKADYDAVLRAGNVKFHHKAYQDRWKSGLYEYLRQLTTRLILMRELLRDDGLLFLHLDWHAVHYARVILDDLFGEKNFVNEIIWTYKSGGAAKKHFSRKHDNILVYSKTPHYKFIPLTEKSYNRGLKPYHFKGVEEFEDEIGWYTNVHMKDVWNIDMVGRTSGERTGYATQKPEQLLRRILACSTEEGDLCADFFCGSGTLPKAAADMGRRFVACDSGALAVESTLGRLMEGTVYVPDEEARKEAAEEVQSEVAAAQAAETATPKNEKQCAETRAESDEVSSGNESANGSPEGPRSGRRTSVWAAGEPGWKNQKKLPAFECRIEVTRGERTLLEEGPLCFHIAGVKERRLGRSMDDKSEERVRKLAETDPLALIHSWSLDFDFDGEIFRPDMLLVRKGGSLEDTFRTRRHLTEAAAGADIGQEEPYDGSRDGFMGDHGADGSSSGRRIMARVTDIMGHAYYEDLTEAVKNCRE